MSQVNNILDLSQFPIVRVNIDRRNSGYTQQWIEEMNILLQRQEPFAIIADTRSQSDNPEDEKIRGDWYRQNNDKLAQWCMVMLYIEPDETKRTKLQRQVEGLRKVFDFTFDVVSSEAEAIRLAPTLRIAKIELARQQ